MAHILIVEDSTTQALRLSFLLEGEGHAVRRARDGQDALRLLGDYRPDMVISDITMPIMNGFELCTHLKNNPDTRQIPVLLLTNLADPNDLIYGLAARADSYLTKPYDDQFLLMRVAECLNPDRPVPPDQQLEDEPLAIRFAGRTHTVTATRAQILNIFLATYENSLLQNRQLTRQQMEMGQLNERLAEKNAQLLELNKTLRDLAIIDGLTDIPNRRRFDEYLQQEWNRALRDHSPLSLIVMDIDYFKLFNDHYGHAAGDECLRQVARTLSASVVRSIDLVARYGGEEFVCILPNTDMEGLVRVGNQFLDNINALQLPHPQSRVAPHVTISLGGATLIPVQESAPSVLVGQADARLYKAKEGGRNRLVTS
ncbi:MAG: diguanylate cyclase [Magnetococcus sp. DMHC-8]